MIYIYYLIFALFIFVIPSRAQTTIIPDSAMKACLASRYPSVLDSNKNLIISQAAKLKDILNCNGNKITSAEGVQYFTGISNLQFSYNPLIYLPAIKNLKFLQVLDISDNLLTIIPSFSTLMELNNLDVKNNKLKVFPDISKNVKLQILSGANNVFDSLPDFSKLVNLKHINIDHNQLSKLPELNTLKLLTDFSISFNKLTNCPTLVNSRLILKIDLSNNSLVAIPELPLTNTLKFLNFSNNDITNLVNFSGLDSLKSVQLQNNKLTFEDLYPLSRLKNYATIFQVKAQQRIKAGQILDTKEGDSISIVTNIDAKIPGIVRNWYFNGAKYKSIGEDSLTFANLTFENQGFYYCELTNSLFPELVISTDSFKINVSKCFDINSISTTVSAPSCAARGALEVKENFKITAGITYILESLQGGKTIESVTGTFKSLVEPQYTLSIRIGKNCIKQFPSLIEIPADNCIEPFMTPDGDGQNDTYFFNESGKITMSDKFGNQVHEIVAPIEWDGTTARGLVSPGLYLCNVNNGKKIIKITVLY